MQAILNNVNGSANDVEAAVRDGYYLRKPDGNFEVTQTALEAYKAACAKLERLASLMAEALKAGGTVESGDLDAGLFVEKRGRQFNDKVILKDVIGEEQYDALYAAADFKFSNPGLRVFNPAIKEEKPKGERVAPTADGQPLPENKADAA
jgi:hypothetical protein